MAREITVIPANKKRRSNGKGSAQEEQKLRVAAYCRVSSEKEEQENSFEQEHSQDTEEELYQYLRDCTRILGYAPRYKEVVGWRIMEQRFGCWNEALQKAGVTPSQRCPVTKLPRIQEVTEKQKELYRQKKAEKKMKNKQRMEAQARKKKENAKI